MTDYRDYQNANYDELRRGRLNADELSRRSGSAGIWVALAVVVLLIAGFFAFSGQAPTTTAQNETPPATTVPATPEATPLPQAIPSQPSQ
jgi:hypothetical protein